MREKTNTGERGVARPLFFQSPSSSPPLLFSGPTGSGKTHTLFGGGPGSDGIIGRAVARLGAASDAPPRTPAPLTPGTATPRPPPPVSFPPVSVSVVEVYCERVYCLLSPGYPMVTLTEGGPGGGGCMGLSGAASLPAHSAAGVVSLIQAGIASRSVGATAANARSSRSHCVVLVRVSSPGAGGAPPAVLALADLAGSERTQKAQTAAGSLELREGCSINQSLSALGNVISVLATALPAGGGGAVPASHIPYRASKLTRLMQGVLGGRASTSFLVCASPAGADADETLSALRFGARARGVAASVMTDIGSSVPGGPPGSGAAAVAAATAAQAELAIRLVAAQADATAARAELAVERAGRAAEAQVELAYRKMVALMAIGLVVTQTCVLVVAEAEARGMW